jgi:hypothetical protein
MKKLTEYIKENKKVIVVIALIILLVLIVVIINNQTSEEQTVTTFSSTQTTTEKKLSELLSNISGVGKAQVMITEGEENIEGVVIVCEGANNIMTRSDILNAVSTALNIQKNIIAIYAMN